MKIPKKSPASLFLLISIYSLAQITSPGSSGKLTTSLCSADSAGSYLMAGTIDSMLCADPNQGGLNDGLKIYPGGTAVIPDPSTAGQCYFVQALATNPSPFWLPNPNVSLLSLGTSAAGVGSPPPSISGTKIDWQTFLNSATAKEKLTVTHQACSVNTCGTANTQSFASLVDLKTAGSLAGGYCSSGTASTISGSGPWSWKCTPAAGPASICSASRSCGAGNCCISNCKTISGPTSPSCSPDNITTGGPWTTADAASCTALGNSLSNCTCNAVFSDSSCGTANGVIAAALPTTNLCSDGSLPAVALVGSNFTWTCGTNSCSAPQASGYACLGLANGQTDGSHTFLESCFSAGTSISMADGSLKNIEEIDTNDFVKTYDEKLHVYTASRVEKTLHHATALSKIFKITLSSGASVEVNDIHRIYTPDFEQYLTVQQIYDLWIQGETVHLLGQENQLPVITEMVWEMKNIPLYNLHVQSVYDEVPATGAFGHNYFAAGILVHNLKPLGDVTAGVTCCNYSNGDPQGTNISIMSRCCLDNAVGLGQYKTCLNGNCSAGPIGWTVGVNTCSGNLPASSGGSLQTVTDASGNSASFLCSSTNYGSSLNSAIWAAQPGATCAPALAANGSCGTAKGVGTSTAPSAGLCAAGNPTSPLLSTTKTTIYTMIFLGTCKVAGDPGGVPCGGIPLTTSCASAADVGNQSKTGPGGDVLICQQGTDISYNWTWSCAGSVTTDTSCTAPATTVFGCGLSANGQFFPPTIAPSAGLCATAAQTASAPSLSGSNWSWTCTDGVGTVTSCTAPVLVPASATTVLDPCGPLIGTACAAAPPGSLIDVSYCGCFGGIDYSLACSAGTLIEKAAPCQKAGGGLYCVCR